MKTSPWRVVAAASSLALLCGYVYMKSGGGSAQAIWDSLVHPRRQVQSAEVAEAGQSARVTSLFGPITVQVNIISSGPAATTPSAAAPLTSEELLRILSASAAPPSTKVPTTTGLDTRILMAAAQTSSEDHKHVRSVAFSSKSSTTPPISVDPSGDTIQYYYATHAPLMIGTSKSSAMPVEVDPSQPKLPLPSETLSQPLAKPPERSPGLQVIVNVAAAPVPPLPYKEIAKKQRRTMFSGSKASLILFDADPDTAVAPEPEHVFMLKRAANPTLRLTFVPTDPLLQQTPAQPPLEPWKSFP